MRELYAEEVGSASDVMQMSMRSCESQRSPRVSVSLERGNLDVGTPRYYSATNINGQLGFGRGFGRGFRHTTVEAKESGNFFHLLLTIMPR